MAEMNIILVVLFYYFVFWMIRRIKKSGGMQQRQSERRSGAAGERTARSAASPSRDSSVRGNTRTGDTRARSTDGHTLTGERDITCRKYGHRHAEDTEPRFLVHDDPGGEEYIILNGQRVKLKEADRYFCR